MTEERITRVEDPATGGAPTTHTTVIRDEAPRSGSGMGLVILLLILIAAVAGFFIWQNQANSQIAADTAVAEAAGDVGDAARQVGNAAETAANEVANN